MLCVWSPWGDLNAVDVAQGTHEAILVEAECMNPHEMLQYRDLVPEGRCWEGLYIDDHGIVQILKSKALRHCIIGYPWDHVSGTPKEFI